MELKFYCMPCRMHFTSEEHEMGKWPGRRNYYAKTRHKCGVYTYKALTKKERRALRFLSAEEA